MFFCFQHAIAVTSFLATFYKKLGRFSYMAWTKFIACAAGQVNSELLEEVEYLREKNRILKSQMDRPYLDS